MVEHPGTPDGDDERDARDEGAGHDAGDEDARGAEHGGAGRGGAEPSGDEWTPSLHPGRRDRPDPSGGPLSGGGPPGFGPLGAGAGMPGMPGMGGMPDLEALLGPLLGGGGGAGAAGFGPAQLGQLMGQLQRMLSGGGEGPVNWDLAHDVARQAASAEGDPSVGQAAERDLREALRLADLWLDAVTDLPAAGGPVHVWSRAQWVESTLPTWRSLVEPVAASVADAMAEAMASQAPEQLRPMLAAAGEAVRQMGGAVFGMQVGQAVGGLAREVVGGTDVGLPLLPDGATTLLPANVTAFGEGLGVPAQEVRLYLALREAAAARLFAHVPWLRAHVLRAVEAYARGISLDPERIERAVRDLDPMDPTAMQEAMSSGVFEPERSPAQQAALDRLETALALVEGWVDAVASAAAASTLPAAAPLREAVRRRRAAGGPAERAFAALVGLELRPRRLREAAALWERLAAEQGTSGRDAVWAHPDLAPTAEDLDDPTAYLARRAGNTAEDDDVDAALERLFAAGPDSGSAGTEDPGRAGGEEAASAGDGADDGSADGGAGEPDGTPDGTPGDDPGPRG